MDNNYTFYSPPPPAGYWAVVPGPRGSYVAVQKRPRWLTRLMCRWLLQWEWVDAKP